MEQRGIILLIAGLALGLVLGFVLCAVSPFTSRYELVVSADGSSVHRIDSWSGKVWQKSARTEQDPDGNIVSIWYWEEVDLKRGAATQAAREIREKTEKEMEARMQEKQEALRADKDLRQKRLNDIYIICEDDEDCIAKKCAAGYGGSEDAEWTAYCTETLKEHALTTVVERCRGEERCIKTYCVNKYNNTYPPVSDCVRDLNLQKAKEQNEAAPAADDASGAQEEQQ